MIRQRGFAGAGDIAAMIAVACANPAAPPHVVDLPYRFSSWALDDPQNIALWVDARDRLLAWAVMQAPFWTIDYAYRPDAEPGIHRRILSWADARARQMVTTPHGRPCWFVMVFVGQDARLRDLEEAGFASQTDVGEDSWSKVLLQRPVEWPMPGYRLPPGFHIRPLAGQGEVAAYVDLHRAVFESKNMTVAWRERSLRQPAYRAELDLVAVAPDGQLAAFCVGWLGQDERGAPVGQIEPLGVRPDFRALGLGRAVLGETMRRSYASGATGIYVETDNYRDAALGLYEAMGFRVLRDILVYRKDYEA